MAISISDSVSEFIVIAAKCSQITDLIFSTMPFGFDMIDFQKMSGTTNFSACMIYKLTTQIAIKNIFSYFGRDRF